jgi:hypothetical protein
MILSLVKELFGMGAGWLKGRSERKKIQLENEMAIANAQTMAKIERLKTGQQADIKWENLSIQKSGLKDEFWTIVLAIPMVLCFIPECVQYVKDGFAALKETPVWYQTLLGVAVGSAFGVRKFANFMKLMKGD